MLDDPQVTAIKLKEGEALRMALRPEEAAAALGVSLAFFYGIMKSGAIRTVRKGRGKKKVRLIPIAALNEYLNSGDDPTDNDDEEQESE